MKHTGEEQAAQPAPAAGCTSLPALLKWLFTTPPKAGVKVCSYGKSL